MKFVIGSKKEKETNDDVNPIVQDDISETEKPKTMLDKIDEINEKLDIITNKKKLSKEKPFKLPFGMNSKVNNLYKTNNILVFYCSTNRTIKPMIAQIQNDYIWLNNKPHNCSLDFVFLWKGKYPATVIKEWDLNPVGTKDYYEAIDDGRDANAYAQVIRMIESEKSLTGTKLGGKTIVWIIIGAIVGGYLLFNK